MGLSRYDLLLLEPDVIRETAECHGLDCDDLTDEQVVKEFGDLLDMFEMVTNG